MTFIFLCLSCSSPGVGIRSAANGDETVIDLDSATYLSTWFPSGKVTLSNGEHREPASPGSASEIVVKLTDKRAFGVVNGKETGAVVLYTQGGGTGTFWDLALLSKGAEGWVNTDTVLLGDRVKFSSIKINDDRIVLSLTVHGPEDPICCPTLEVEKRFAVQGNRLVPDAGEAQKGDPWPVVGTDWQWVHTLYNDGEKHIPPDPNKYTLRFLDGGALNVRADCNRKGGRYTIRGNRLWIEITHSTRAACEEGSLEDQFVRDLSAGATYFLKDGDLYIGLKYDSGTMKLRVSPGDKAR
jgi:heat shock protein HslJ